MSAIALDERGFRYRPLVKLASGGMATVYLGALDGPAGFRQIVAIKRPHAHLLEQAEMRDAALAEARIAARFRHANVVDVRDVEVSGEAIQLVMDYVEGATLSTLLSHFARRKERIPTSVAMRIVLDACAGLSAVHEATDEVGAPLGLVHRDISPQNILVGVDGVARVSDFGTVKEWTGERPLTTQGTLKGKPGYMAPEYVQRGALDARSDELSLAVVAWEAFAGKRLFRGATDFETFERVLREVPSRLSDVVPPLAALDEPIARALAKDPDARFATVRDFAGALTAAWPEIATPAEVGALVASVVGEDLRARREELRARLAEMDAARSDPSIAAMSAPSSVTPRSAPSMAGMLDPSSVAVLAEEAPTVRASAPSEVVVAARTAAIEGTPSSRRRAIVVVATVVAAALVIVGIAFVSRQTGDDSAGSTRAAIDATTTTSAEAASTTSDTSIRTAAITATTTATITASAASTIAAPRATAGAPATNSTAKKGPKPPPPNPY